MSRITRVSLTPTADLALGWSPLAIRTSRPWNDKDRTKTVHGLVVHTTGSGLPSKAKKKGIYHTVAAQNWYRKSHGTHFVNGWRGLDGDFFQMANERERAGGVGTKELKAAINDGDWTKGLPPSFVRRWYEWWKEHVGVDNPLDLFPGTWANNVYVHCEMIPCVFHHNRRLITAAEPREGTRFTQAQHDAIVWLSLDLSERYGWPSDWWLIGHLVGHDDLSPHTRTIKSGGWDPGHLRAKPYFDFQYVRDTIFDIYYKEIA